MWSPTRSPTHRTRNAGQPTAPGQGRPRPPNSLLGDSFDVRRVLLQPPAARHPCRTEHGRNGHWHVWVFPVAADRGRGCHRSRYVGRLGAAGGRRRTPGAGRAPQVVQPALVTPDRSGRLDCLGGRRQGLAKYDVRAAVHRDISRHGCAARCGASARPAHLGGSPALFQPVPFDLHHPVRHPDS